MRINWVTYKHCGIPIVVVLKVAGSIFMRYSFDGCCKPYRAHEAIETKANNNAIFSAGIVPAVSLAQGSTRVHGVIHSGDVGVEGSVTDAVQAQARSKNRVPHLVPRLSTLLSITAKKRCKVCLWLCCWLCSKDSKLGHP